MDYISTSSSRCRNQPGPGRSESPKNSWKTLGEIAYLIIKNPTRGQHEVVSRQSERESEWGGKRGKKEEVVGEPSWQYNVSLLCLGVKRRGTSLRRIFSGGVTEGWPFQQVMDSSLFQPPTPLNTSLPSSLLHTAIGIRAENFFTQWSLWYLVFFHFSC